ncbi:hypothetical protein [Haloferula sp.]|uniref:hypothetical protein n=1 Tax=Haloferula sp. TaxID=2497595 RepID=UPI00329F1BD4
MITVFSLPPRREIATVATRRLQQTELEIEARYRQSLANARELAAKKSEDEVVKLRIREEMLQEAIRDESVKTREEERLKRHCDWMRRRPAPVPREICRRPSIVELVVVRLLACIATSGAVLAFSLRSNPGWFGWSSAGVAFLLALVAPSVFPHVSRWVLKWSPNSIQSSYSVAVPACALSLMTGVLLLWKGPRLPKVGPVGPSDARALVSEVSSDGDSGKPNVSALVRED